MAEYRMKIIDDGNRVIVKKQQVETIHGVPWRISLSLTVNNSKRQIKKAIEILDRKRKEYYDMSREQLVELFPSQYERHIKNLDKKSNVRKSYRLDTLLDRYFTHMKMEGAKVEQVIIDESNTLNRHIKLKNWCGRDVRTITASELDELFLSFFIETPNRARGTWKKDISRWQHFFDWIVKIDYLESNPLRLYEWTTPSPLKNVNKTKVPKRVYTKPMTDMLYDYLDDRPMNYRYKRALQLLIDTGLRIGECLALKLEDIKNVALFEDSINERSHAYGRLQGAYNKGIRSSLNIKDVDDLTALNKEHFLRNFESVKYYNELIIYNIHDLEYRQDDLLFFADMTDDIDSLLLIRKTVVKKAYKGNTVHEIQDKTKSEQGMRAVRLNKRARRTLTLLYREIQADPSFNTVSRLWQSLGRSYLFIQADGKFVVPNNLSSNLRYITKRLSEMEDSMFFPITAHDLRHAYATDRVSRALYFSEVVTISKELGHSNPSITLELYSHSTETSLLYESPDL